MSNIAKFLSVVILLAACNEGRRMPEIDASISPFGGASVVGELPSEINESSGLVASLCQDGVLWTHNDSGDGPFIYAIDKSAKVLGIWRVDGAQAEDWEDMSTRRDESGKCVLYAGDIGNTDKQKRDTHRIYRFSEPSVQASGASPSKQNAAATSPSQNLEFRYPEGNQDAETMIVEPVTGNIYILTKSRSKPSIIYKLPSGFESGKVLDAQRVSEFTVPTIPNGFITGGAISSDGRSVLICDYAAGYEIRLPDGTTEFDEIWKQKVLAFPLGQREQGEAISYSADGNSVFATSERKGAKLIEVRRQ